jgi:16S rRNA processing protein RimM
MDKIYIAKIGKTVGLKGLLKLHIDTDFPEQFKIDATFTTNRNQTLTIESINKNNNTVKFFGIDNIEDAQKYINSQIFTTQEDTIKNCSLNEKEFFWFDIMNCNIIEEDKWLGKIIDIHRYPSEDYLEISVSTEILEFNDKFPKTFLIPYTDHYIINVDLDKKVIEVQNAFDILEAS